MNGNIPQHDLDAARAVSIREIWGWLGLPPVPEHGNICSPFRRDENPTCQMGGTKNILFDFATKESFDTIKLVRRVLDCSFADAVNFVLGRPSHNCTAKLVEMRRIGRLHSHTPNVETKSAEHGAPFSSPEEKVYGWTPPGRPAAVYYYNLPDGSPLYRKVRYQTPTGKITPFQRYDPERDAWIGGEGCMEGIKRVLYRNEQLPGFQQVFVVEGEKCADCLWDLGILAVCNDSGADHWLPEISEALRGKDVVILPDNDDPGRAHGELVARSLVGIARSIKVVELPGLGPKQDVYDWLSAYGEDL